MQKLLTKEILKKLPAIGATSELEPENVKVITKFFYPAGAASWYVTEYDSKDQMCFGFANLGDDQMAELGYFSLEELKNIKHPKFPFFRVERDKFWNPKTTLDQVINFQVR